MRSSLQKPFNSKLDKRPKICNYSNISKLEHERRERGFQVFISGANKERIKIRDLQVQEALQAKKAKINTNILLARKLKPPNNTFTRRKFWQKSSNIKIKGSDGSKFSLQNHKSPKSDIGPYGSVLHDITAKIGFHPSAQNNSQLNFIQNRYKAYFHVDGYGFFCSKKTSKPSIPSKYQIDGASPIFNKNNSTHLKLIQNKHALHSCSPKPYNNEEQKIQYHSLLDRNHERISKLQEFLTPDYEYFQSAKRSVLLDSFKGIASEASCADSCNGVIYDVFYHKEQNISRSARALLLVDNQDENGSISDNVFSQGDSTSCASLQISNLEKNEDENEEIVFYEDERALVLLETQKSVDGSINGNNKNEEIQYLPPLERALSPIFKLVKNSFKHEEEKGSCFVQEYQYLLKHDDKSSNNSTIDSNLTSNNVNDGKKSTLKLNLRYFCQGIDFKVLDRPTSNPIQSYDGDGTSINFNNNGLSWTPKCSTSYSSTPRSYHASHTWMNSLEKLDSKLHIEKSSKLPIVDFSTIKNNDRKKKVPICPRKIERVTKIGEFLSARVKKLDIKKQIYLSHILDKLEIAQVTGSVDHNICQYSPISKENLLIELLV